MSLLWNLAEAIHLSGLCGNNRVVSVAMRVQTGAGTGGVSDAGCYAYGLVWLFGTLPELPLRMVERAKGGHMNPKQGTFFRKYAGGRCQSESRAAMAVQPGIRGSPAASLAAEKGPRLSLSGCAYSALVCRFGTSVRVARVAPWDPTPKCEPKSTIGHLHTTVATSTQHQPRKPQASNLSIR